MDKNRHAAGGATKDEISRVALERTFSPPLSGWKPDLRGERGLFSNEIFTWIKNNVQGGMFLAILLGWKIF